MKDFFTFTFIVLLAFNYFTVTAQDESPPDSIYWANLRAYYEEQAEDDTTKIKQLLRFEAKIGDKLDQRNSLIPYNRAMSGTCAEYCNLPDLAAWELVGPVMHQENLVQWNGYVEEVSLDPTKVNTANPEDFALLGSTGGIFKFNPTQVWENKTDALGEYGIGITKILRHPNNPDQIIAATGISHQGDYGNSMGLISSPDNGNTWTSWPMFSSFDPCQTTIKGIYYNYDNFGSLNSISTNFFVIARNTTAATDELWEWCPTVGGGPHWVNHTPQEYIDMVNCTHPTICNPHLQLYDFTATANSVVLTTSSPYSSQHAFMFYSQKSGICTTFNWVDNTLAMPPTYSSTNNQAISISDYKKDGTDDVIFARTAGNANNYLYRSVDGGLTWTQRTSNIFGNAQLDIEYSPNTKLVYLANVRMMVWDDANSDIYQAGFSDMHVDIRDYDILPVNTGIDLVGIATDGGVVTAVVDISAATPNINAPGVFTFNPISGVHCAIRQDWGVAITQSNNPDLLIGVMHGNYMAQTTTNTCRFGGGDGAAININHADNSTFYYSINPYIYKKDLSNVCSFSNGTYLNRTTQWQFGRPSKLHPANHAELYYGNDKGGAMLAAHLEIYNDIQPIFTASKSLSNVTGNNSGHYMDRIGAIGLSEMKPSTIYVGTNSGKTPGNSGVLLKSTNKGDNWVDLSHNPVTWASGTQTLTDVLGWIPINDIEVSPYDDDKVWIAIGGTFNNSSYPNQGHLRVLESTDGGMTWNDKSEDLPPIPINDLIFDKNSNDRLFALTDSGVFYRDNTMSNWECFNENLPLVFTTNGKINNCTNELFVATYGRSTHKTSLNTLPNVPRVHEITSNQTWRTQRVIYSDVVVKAGVSLNINDSKIKLAEDVRIIVEPTASLQITNSELSSLCEDTCWDGITVEGNTNQPQSASFQGSVFISNCTISNAKSAVNSRGIDANGNTAWNFMGGIFRIINTTFINNRRALSFGGYYNIDGTNPEQANVSWVENCDFIVDNDYISSCGSNSPFITMFSSNGVQISGCHFIDARTGLTNASDYRSGVYSEGATFIVKPSVLRNCKFTNLFKAVEVKDIDHTNDFEVEVLDAEFYKCETGIRMSNINNESKIIDNLIEIGNPSSTSSFGIVLHNSSGFTVEENQCDRSSGYGGFSRCVDVLNVYNANNPIATPHFGPNVIYNNISRNNSEGFTAWTNGVGRNLSTHSNGYGLEFLCNQNISNGTDFRFDDCVKVAQGSPAFPAGNIFSGGSSTAFKLTPAANGCGIIYHNGAGVPPPPTTNIVGSITIQNSPNTSNCVYANISNFVATNIDDVDNDLFSNLSLYPNPTNSNITIGFEASRYYEEIGITVLNSQGSVLIAKQLKGIENGFNQFQLDLSAFESGVYMVYLKTDHGFTVEKFIKLTD